MNDLSQQINALVKGRKQCELEAFIFGSDTQNIINILKCCIHHHIDGPVVWNAVLAGFTDVNRTDELFRIVMSTLQHLKIVEIPNKHAFDIVFRLLAELDRFESSKIIEMIEYCLDSIRLGDAKFVGWMSLFPELIKLLNEHVHLIVNGIPMSGLEYREQCINQICTMRWHNNILTSITMMFREIHLSQDEKTRFLNKICDNLDLMEPTALPPLAYQIFRVCDSAFFFLMAIHGFSCYFQKHLYARISADSEANRNGHDIIEQYSSQELQEAQDTILFHLGKATEFQLNEKDLVRYCRPMAATPSFLLSPFFLSAFLSVASINRYPESTLLSSSQLIPFVRILFQNTTAENRIGEQSAWARSVPRTPRIDLSRILNVLVNQSSNGNEIVTPGMIWLSFALLKSSSSESAQLHQLASVFLERFVRKRFIFGAGIVKSVMDFALADLDAAQFGECLTRLSMSNTYTVSNCASSLQRFFDLLLLIPGKHAMRLMSFIIPLCKSSSIIRDIFIETLKKATCHRDIGTRKMGVFGFCLVLKHLRENNIRRSNASDLSNRSVISQHCNQKPSHDADISRTAGCDGEISNTFRRNLGMVLSQQHNISSYSSLSQTVISNECGNTQQNYVMLALGVLRKCFNQTYEVKAVLYAGLDRAIDFNPNLTPHIVKFLESHFHSYFEMPDMNDRVCDRSKAVTNQSPFVFRIANVLREQEDISVWDHIGHLMQLMSHCVYVCKQKGMDQHVRKLVQRLDTLVERISEVTLDDIIGSGDDASATADCTHVKVRHLGGQFISCLEALMGYAVWSDAAQRQKSDSLGVVLVLFDQHRNARRFIEAHHSKSMNVKLKKGKKPQSRTTLEFPNIWDLATITRMLKFVFGEGPSASLATSMHSKDFGRYVLRIAVEHIGALPTLADVRHIRHSQSKFVQLCTIGRMVWNLCIKPSPNSSVHFDDRVTAHICFECFRECMNVSQTLYTRKFDSFLQAITLETSNNGMDHNCAIILANLKTMLEKCFHGEMYNNESAGNVGCDEYDNKTGIEHIMLQCMDILLARLSANQAAAMDSYQWLYNACLNNDVHAFHMSGLIHKLLFEQRVRTHTGRFFDSIGRQIEQVLTEADINAGVDSDITFRLRSIQPHTVNIIIPQLCSCIREQITAVNLFVSKVQSMLAQLRIIGAGTVESTVQDMRLIEQSISVQLIQIAKAITPLASVGLPTGYCTDSVVRLLLDFYVCVANYTKHLLARHSVVPIISHATIKFDLLVRNCGRPLAIRVYHLIEHIENAVFADEKYSRNAVADRAKVLRVTRQLPRLVLRMEQFNRVVMALGKHTKIDLTGHLHIGTVRDFKINKSALKNVKFTGVSDEDEHCESVSVSENSVDSDDEQEHNNVDRLSTGSNISSATSSRLVQDSLGEHSDVSSLPRRINRKRKTTSTGDVVHGDGASVAKKYSKR